MQKSGLSTDNKLIKIYIKSNSDKPFGGEFQVKNLKHYPKYEIITMVQKIYYVKIMWFTLIIQIC